ncbi:glycosyltransferase [Nonomuraea polychroma]|uniref:glycosyltransferase n=1 Tax=Nonomuraea polychroma TaxID=46176 RepID=UPI001F4E9489|nr:glycosyltransferase [Nonomuraea polychroma]
MNRDQGEVAADSLTLRDRRVLLLLGQLRIGGTEKQVVLLAQGLRARGFVVHVALLFEGGPLEDDLVSAGIPVHHLHLRRGNSVVHNLMAFGRLCDLFRKIRPHVVHAFLYHSYVLGAPAAYITRVPVVVAGRRSLSDFKRGRRWVFALERAATRITHHIVANAIAVAEDARTLEGVPHDKISVIYNGLRPSAFVQPATTCLSASKPVVLCVANLKPGKGHEYLVEAAARARTPFTLVLVGAGPTHDQIAQQASRLGVEVELLGSQSDVTPLLFSADVVVLPSLHEGMSNAIMEAMAAARPIVATAVGGNVELLEGRGLLVPPKDPDALAAALDRLLQDREQAAELGMAAKSWAMKNLDLDTMVDQHVDLYLRLMERRCVA